MREKDIQEQIIEATKRTTNIRLFRNNVGNFFTGKPIDKAHGIVTLLNFRRVKCGLHEGSADLIGWKKITITPDMVGKEIAVFMSVEVKNEKGKCSEDQTMWKKIVSKFGGISIVARSVEDVLSGNLFDI